MIKKCFTINQNRTTEEFIEYNELLNKKVFSAIEIFFPYDKTEEEKETYINNVYMLQKNDIEVVLHLPHGYKNDLCTEVENDVILERFKKAIDFGKLFNVNKMTLHLGSAHHKDRNKLIDKCIENVKLLADYAYPSNIMIENMPQDNEMGYSPSEILTIIKESNRKNVKFILDFGHANVSEYSIYDYIDTLKDYLMHLHISDNNGLRDEHKPIGEGNIDYKNVFKKLNDYKELYCLEIIYQTKNDLLRYNEGLNKIL